ncbi:MAG: D-ribose pyranase [Clostridium baratii]|uniref:D-ribose pyranase n=1 Tax=Clostridium baratii str. Sullivan TaxID=1415775 RepID=A0A0A7FVJ1_9CLOT|nr:D-ribose pyranase [Clostridium baratii]AIY83654.1 rbsD / FucU transport family protein [Clostridium baratii str. Sullivan]MBS6006099.1 D-ribose pyranase [Clostridium baratii]MDU1053171.1 D-ribose pyranase [Clostridium baratii]MDU4911300.1 D-ribose pyranase [Clostridium baratii]CUP13132.1 D-ribose pyranase [Clostridium baratii]
MRKTKLLNSQISSVISEMGHTDTLAIGDCGLPIPKDVKRIDLAIIKNLPTFMDTLKAVLLELEIEEATLAVETAEVSKKLYEEIEKEIGDVRINFVSHEQLKEELKECRAVIRTGEQTPYANIILKSGVVF